MKLTTLYKQLDHNIPFYDIDTIKDTLLYIDPNRVMAAYPERADIISQFWFLTLEGIRKKKDPYLVKIRKELSEPNETRLGMSEKITSHGTQGKGIGKKKAIDMLKSISRSKVIKTGLIEDIKSISLFVPGVGPDNISDIVTNLIKIYLMEYTKAQCIQYKIKLKKFKIKCILEEKQTLKRSNKIFELPFDKYGPIIFTPKSILSFNDRFSSNRIYNSFVLNNNIVDFDEYGILSESRKSGEVFITKKKVKNYHKNKQYKGLSKKEIIGEELLRIKAVKNKDLYLKAKEEEQNLYQTQIKKYGGDPKIVNQ